MFELAHGSTVGRNHRLIGLNNQDASAFYNSDELMVAVVCDGCGSSPHSEVGAQIGAKLTTYEIVSFVAKSSLWMVDRSWWWEELRESILSRIFKVASLMGPNTDTILGDYFLFTTVGVLATPQKTIFFSVGDGVICVNGEVTVLGPFPGNAPPYIAYGLWDPDRLNIDQGLLRFQIPKVVDTSEVQSFLIGTDGVGDLVENAKANIPGQNKPVGPLSQFWEVDAYFTNQVALSRRLGLIGADRPQVDWDGQMIKQHSGLLPDDTTIIVGRSPLEQEG